MSDGRDERQLLRDFRQATGDRKRGSSLLPLVMLGVFAICAGAGAFYFRSTISELWLSQTGGQSSNTWVLPEGKPSMGDANRCLSDGNLPCAEADLLAYLKQYPNDAHATALLAITLTQDGRHKEALYYYKRAEAMGTGTYDFYAGYAKTLDTLGDTDGAIAKNQAALRLVPSLVDVRGDLADELVRKGRAKEALDLLTSFDDELESKGYPPYFKEQIRRIKQNMGGEFAKEAESPNAPLSPTNPHQTLVRGEPDRGSLAVPVSIDGEDARLFTVDSGASVIAMPSADAERLRKRGLIRQGDERGSRQIQLANGTIVTASVFNLRSVKVGDCEVEDVEAAFYPGDGPRLLGQSFLKRFKSWSIDNSKRTLTLNN
jgi:clan AA aspartic protease (TIGR02281 family)